MKYGVLIHEKTKNIGDDIQSYAASCFLPSIDYLVDRDTIDTFESENDEKVAVIMSGWWGWKKWNWPPANCIVPKLVGMHVMDYGVREWGSPIYDEHLEGIGGGYLNCYGPVGARDNHTLKLLKKHNIDSYFSGCITLTLPKMKIKKSKQKYICLVDVSNDVITKVKELAQQKNMKVKIMTHSLPDGRENMTWEERSKSVEKLLTVYQNAECVITTRLHVMLPCFAMEVPVLCINNSSNRSRFLPYADWCECVTEKQFMDGKCDIFNLKMDFKKIKKVRNKMIKSINEFIDETVNKPCELCDKVNYTEEEKIKWQYDLMKKTLDKWLIESRDLVDDYNNTSYKLWQTENELKMTKERLKNIENSKGYIYLEKFRTIRSKISVKKNK